VILHTNAPFKESQAGFSAFYKAIKEQPIDENNGRF
jgi:hypothetical protein